MKTADITDLDVVLCCNAARAAGFAKGASLGRLIHRTGAPEKVAWGAMERASRRGLIEYGTSLRCAWPTPKGEELLGGEQRP